MRKLSVIDELKAKSERLQLTAVQKEKPPAGRRRWVIGRLLRFRIHRRRMDYECNLRNVDEISKGTEVDFHTYMCLKA